MKSMDFVGIKVDFSQLMQNPREDRRWSRKAVANWISPAGSVSQEPVVKIWTDGETILSLQDATTERIFVKSLDAVNNLNRRTLNWKWSCPVRNLRKNLLGG